MEHSLYESTYSLRVAFLACYAPPRAEALSDDARRTSVCLSVYLSRTSGLSREQRGLGRLKLAVVAHVTGNVTHWPARSTCRGCMGYIVAASRTACSFRPVRSVSDMQNNPLIFTRNWLWFHAISRLEATHCLIIRDDCGVNSDQSAHASL